MAPGLHRLLLALLVACANPLLSQGFDYYSSPYPVPRDGAVHGMVPLGFARTGSYGLYGHAVGTHQWQTIDMNGDGWKDLVVTSEYDSLHNRMIVIGGYTSPSWKVHLGGSSGFSASPLTWSVPVGGFIDYVDSCGFNAFTPMVLGTLPELGSEHWEIFDINADGRPDLVVTGANQGMNYHHSTFRNGAQDYWKVYLNNGGGFAPSPMQWNVPDGGNEYDGQLLGFHRTQFRTFYQSSSPEHMTWDTKDLNGDSLPDLVVTSFDNGGIGSPGNFVWWVYLNSGNGFSPTPINWTLPSGGYERPFADNIGYIATDWSFSYGGDIGTACWHTTDMDQDGRDDLVVSSIKLASQNGPVFGLPAQPHWRVYHNNGTGFDTTYSTWTVPHGGIFDAGQEQGFGHTTNYYTPSSMDGTQLWEMIDIDGDADQDLVVTATGYNFVYTSFQPDNNPFWKVYFNNGAGFDTLAYHWPIPYGGRRQNGDLLGFTRSSDNAYYNDDLGSRNWDLLDMDGDARPDFVLTGTKLRTDADGIVFGWDTNYTHWKIHWNTAATMAVPSQSIAPEALPVGPNPADDILHIGPAPAKGQLRIADIHGRVLYAAPLVRAETTTLETGTWPRGVYLLQFVTAAATSTKKLILQ